MKDFSGTVISFIELKFMKSNRLRESQQRSKRNPNKPVLLADNEVLSPDTTTKTSTKLEKILANLEPDEASIWTLRDLDSSLEFTLIRNPLLLMQFLSKLSLSLQNSFQYTVYPERLTDCRNKPEPCPWVSCKFHTTNLPQNQQEFNATRILNQTLASTRSCVLDVIDSNKGGAEIEEVAEVLRLKPERVSTLLNRAIHNLRRLPGDLLSALDPNSPN